jgi:hypothetical protein
MYLYFRYIPEYCSGISHAVTQEVSRLLLIEVSRVQSQSSLCEIRGGLSRTAAGFVRVLRFPLSILVAPNAPFLSAIISGCYNALFTAEVSMLSVSQLHM